MRRGLSAPFASRPWSSSYWRLGWSPLPPSSSVHPELALRHCGCHPGSSRLLTRSAHGLCCRAWLAILSDAFRLLSALTECWVMLLPTPLKSPSFHEGPLAHLCPCPGTGQVSLPNTASASHAPLTPMAPPQATPPPRGHVSELLWPLLS